PALAPQANKKRKSFALNKTLAILINVVYTLPSGLMWAKVVQLGRRKQPKVDDGGASPGNLPGALRRQGPFEASHQLPGVPESTGRRQGFYHHGGHEACSNLPQISVGEQSK